MDTKSKKSKYNPFIKFTAVLLAIIFSFLAGMSCLNYIRKSIFFGNSDKSTLFAETPAFSQEMSPVFSRLRALKAYVNLYEKGMTFEDFKNTETAESIIDYWQTRQDRAIKLFDTIQQLKALRPEEASEERIVLYYDPTDDMYFDENRNEWLSYPEIDNYYQRENVIIYDYDEEYDGNGYSEATSYSISIPSDDELFRLEKSYSDFQKWDEKYQQLRYELFQIVNDATSHETIKSDINERCFDNLHSQYNDMLMQIDDALKSFVNISFVLKDNKTGNFISNLENDENIKSFTDSLSRKSLYYVSFDGKKLHSPVPSPRFNSGILKFLGESGVISDNLFNNAYFSDFEDFSIYLKLTSEVVQGDNFYNIYNAFRATQETSAETYLYCSLVFIIISLAAIAAVCIMSGRMEDGSIRLLPLDKFPFIPATLLALASLICIFALIAVAAAADLSLSSILGPEEFFWIITDHSILVATGLLFAVFTLILISYLLYIERNVKAGTLANRFLIGFLGKKLNHLKKNRDELSETANGIRKKTIVALLGYVLINLILLIFCLTDFVAVSLVAMILFNGISVAYAFKYLSDVSRLCAIAEQIRNGSFDSVIRPSSYVTPLRKFATDLNACRDSIQSAIDNAIKGEHLKTELITNVSHDLKTPLTSIINYVSLLKICKMQGEDATKYLDILDDKSKKLQRLIEDLTEASKANSGNISMNLSTVNLNELALQAAGENSDVLENVGLDLVLTEKEKDIFVKADSQHTFRVIDNLFSNAKKYSLSGTRVYVDVYKEGSFGIIAIKNISREKLNITPDELTERFVRGDNSRSTDGSGLGLSIARSFTELQNGSFEIKIDGDMFLASVKLPICLPPKKEEAPQRDAVEEPLSSADVP